jgi:CubicO group peptidase (beta-lactamase class C family)
MEKWLQAALGYVQQWLSHQIRLTQQPGAVLAIAHRGKPVLEQAFGLADVDTGRKLAPRHRFRVASHSKSFTAAGILKLREQGRLSLDDPAGRHVKGLHPTVAKATLAQLLSHSAGIIRDGTDSDQWVDRRPFLNEEELRAALAEPLVIDANTRFKYSNHGFGLAGLVIEAVTGEPYGRWIRREIVAAAGLAETEPDIDTVDPARMASGHSCRLPLGRRVAIPGRNSTGALAPATGFVATAGDLTRFFSGLDPAAKAGVLDAASRREMVRPQWRSPHSSIDLRYGLGLMIGRSAGWDWFGHGGAFQGFISRTAMLPEASLTISLVTNAIDGPAAIWLGGVTEILCRFAREGAPARRLADWTGRWWSIWRAVDLVPMGDKVLVAHPDLANPFEEAAEISVSGRDRGRLALANGFDSHGEQVHRLRNARGQVTAVRLGGGEYRSEARLIAEMEKRYGGGRKAKSKDAPQRH